MAIRTPVYQRCCPGKRERTLGGRGLTKTKRVTTKKGGTIRKEGHLGTLKKAMDKEIS